MTETAPVKPQEWQWRTAKDNVSIYTGSVTGLALFGLGLSQVFNPVALAVAGAYAGYKVIKGAIAPVIIPAARNKYFKDAVAEGRLTPLEEQHTFTQLVRDVSQQAGLAKTPDVYVVDQEFVKTVAKGSLDWEWRWVLSVPKVGEKLAEEASKKLYAALPGMNAVITTREALAENRPASEMRYTIAHEIGHLKADKLSPIGIAKSIVQNVSKALFIGCAAAGALALAGVSLPIAVGGLTLLKAAGALYGLRLLSKFGTKFANRVMEKRADRNAMYLARDFNAGKSMLEHLMDKKTGKKRPAFLETLDSYPSLPYRVESLKISFDKASAYPVLPGTPEPAAAPVETKPAFFIDPSKPWSEIIKQAKENPAP